MEWLLEITFSQIIRWLNVTMLLVMVLLAFFLQRQVSLMDRVVNVPIGGWFKFLVRGYLLITLIMTAIVMLV